MTERTVRHRDGGPKVYAGPLSSRRGQTHTVDADLAEYLVDETGYFEYVTEDGSAEDETSGKNSEPETGDGYTRDELESMDWPDLRALAVESDREGINGKTPKAEIIDALAEE